MAGDWIKMRVWLARDPRVIRMADYLSEQRPFMNWLTDPVQQSCKETAYEHVTRNVISALCVTGLLVTWGTAREQGDRDGDDLVLSHCDKYTLDAITDIECFGEAMEFVGWLVELENGSVKFPKFFKDNESPDEKHKRQNAERQARFRDKHQSESNDDVTLTSNVTVTPREEKRREEVNLTSAKADDGKPDGCPPCPIDEVIAIYHETLPTSPQVRVRTAARDKSIRARWQQFYQEGDFKDKAGGIECFRWYFGQVKASPFLTGQTDKPFRPDLEWLTKQSNFAKVIEGRYSNGTRQ